MARIQPMALGVDATYRSRVPGIAARDDHGSERAVTVLRGPGIA